jgi:hypothetical protein
MQTKRTGSIFVSSFPLTPFPLSQTSFDANLLKLTTAEAALRSEERFEDDRILVALIKIEQNIPQSHHCNKMQG